MSSVTKKLEIVKNNQDKLNFCYAAVLEALINFYAKKTETNQTEICKYYTDNVPVEPKDKPAKDGSYKQDPLYYLQYRNMHAKTIPLEGNSLPVHDIIKEIDLKHPVIMKVDNAHYVMIYGYEGVIPPEGRIPRSLKTNFKFFVYDPVKPNDINNSVDFLATTYQSDYEPGKKGVNLQINGVYLTKSPLDGGRKSKKHNHRKSKKHNRRKSKKHNRRTTTKQRK